MENLSQMSLMSQAEQEGSPSALDALGDTVPQQSGLPGSFVDTGLSANQYPRFPPPNVPFDWFIRANQAKGFNPQVADPYFGPPISTPFSRPPPGYTGPPMPPVNIGYRMPVAPPMYQVPFAAEARPEDIMQNVGAEPYLPPHRREADRRNREPEKKLSNLKIAPYDGNDTWEDWYQQFQLWTRLQDVPRAQMSAALAVNLRGKALRVFSSLPRDQQDSLEQLVLALSRRFGSGQKSSLYRVQARSRTYKRGESLSELAEDIRRNVAMGWPADGEATHEAIAKDCFINALPANIRRDVWRGDPTTLEETEALALRLEACYLSEQTKDKKNRSLNDSFDSQDESSIRSASPQRPILKPKVQTVESSQTTELLTAIKGLTTLISESLAKPQTKPMQSVPKKVQFRKPKDQQPLKADSSQKSLACFECGSTAHFKNNCPIFLKKKLGAARMALEAYLQDSDDEVEEEDPDNEVDTGSLNWNGR